MAGGLIGLPHGRLRSRTGTGLPTSSWRARTIILIRNWSMFLKPQYKQLAVCIISISDNCSSSDATIVSTLGSVLNFRVSPTVRLYKWMCNCVYNQILEVVSKLGFCVSSLEWLPSNKSWGLAHLLNPVLLIRYSWNWYMTSLYRRLNILRQGLLVVFRFLYGGIQMWNLLNKCCL